MRALSWFVLVVGSLGTPAAAAPADRGIYPELSSTVERTLAEAPPSPISSPARLLVDEMRHLATLYAGVDPKKVYPYPLAPEARAELARVAPALREERGAPSRVDDHDGDGIVDRLDIVRGAHKLLHNRAAYHERYERMSYPGGDVRRTEGVCTDTIVRALRNAGIDLQREVHDDIVSARARYPMVERIDTNINHRRVKTILVWFRRHFATLPTGADYQPGDVVFFDTFPSKPGAEHVGIVSDRMASDGQPLVVNNWTDGTVDAEMPLLGAIAVTDHFRVDGRLLAR